MITRTFKELTLPLLGVGMMRLPLVDDDMSHIDEEEADKMFSYALEHGVNYFDTAWGYHNGNSERLVGKLLSKYPRESFYLASKFPGYDLSNMDKVEEIFEEQLERCGVDYFDFYLIHNVCELNIDEYLNEEHGIMSYLCAQREQGRIRHLGFSTHSSNDSLERFLKAYGAHMEFCQIQINWVDWALQNAKDKLALASEYQLPIWAMEPLRGGKLASLSEGAEAELKALRPDEGIPAWSFRYLQSIPEITVILGGMSNFEQMKENIETFKTEKPLNSKELLALQNIATSLTSSTTLDCTSCKYCLSHCPEELNIPLLIELYNDRTFTGKESFLASMGLDSLPEDKRPSACIECRSCEAVCPQQLSIADTLKEFAELMA